MGLIALGSDPATTSTMILDQVIDVIEKKMFKSVQNKSMLNIILDFYIQLCPKSKHECLRSMVVNDCFPGYEQINVNKTQRY